MNKKVWLCLFFSLLFLFSSSLALAVNTESYNRVLNAESSYISPTSVTRVNSMDTSVYMYNYNTSCNTVADGISVPYATCTHYGYSDGSTIESSATAYANGGSTAYSHFYWDFGSAGSAYRLKLDNPHTLQTRMIGSWTPN